MMVIRMRECVFLCVYDAHNVRREATMNYRNLRVNHLDAIIAYRILVFESLHFISNAQKDLSHGLIHTPREIQKKIYKTHNHPPVRARIHSGVMRVHCSV